MRIALIAAGAVLDLMGSVWILQGVGILPGSFMSGQPEWTVYGVLAVAVGTTLVIFGSRRRRGV